MKTAVVCANGKAGQLIVKEALERGLDVTAVVRGENRTAAEKVLKKDLFDLTREDLDGFDAVVDAFGADVYKRQVHAVLAPNLRVADMAGAVGGIVAVAEYHLLFAHGAAVRGGDVYHIRAASV